MSDDEEDEADDVGGVGDAVRLALDVPPLPPPLSALIGVAELLDVDVDVLSVFGRFSFEIDLSTLLLLLLLFDADTDNGCCCNDAEFIPEFEFAFESNVLNIF